jgi:hypothetical protein
MVDPIVELKTRAEILHGRLAAADVAARSRLRALPELAKATDDALAEAAPRMQRKHCLAVVAREHGFSSWDHAKRVLEGDAGERDVGTLMYDDARMSGFLNAWYADYAEARAHLDEARGRGERQYLLAYRTQFFVTGETFVVERLGLDADDEDWKAIDYDWARPRDPAARRRLYKKRLDARP